MFDRTFANALTGLVLLLVDVMVIVFAGVVTVAAVKAVVVVSMLVVFVVAIGFFVSLDELLGGFEELSSELVVFTGVSYWRISGIVIPS